MYLFVHYREIDGQRKDLEVDDFTDVKEAREHLLQSVAYEKDAHALDACDILLFRDHVMINNVDTEVVKMIATSCNTMLDSEHVWYIHKIL